MSWYLAQSEAGQVKILSPFDEATANDALAMVGGKSRLYEAESKNKAEAAHLAFLTKIARGHEAW